MSAPVRESARTRTRRYIIRLVTDAMLVAMYFVLARVAAIDTPLFQFSISSLPILLCAFLFSPLDTFAVSLLGSFLEQMLGEYGLMPTTPLWMAPVVLFGLYASFLVWLCRYNPKTWQAVVIVVTSEVLFTLLNTAGLYVDSRIYSYPVAALAVLLPKRLLAAAVRMVITVPLFMLVIEPVKKLANKRGRVTPRRAGDSPAAGIPAVDTAEAPAAGADAVNEDAAVEAENAPAESDTSEQE